MQSGLNTHTHTCLRKEWVGVWGAQWSVGLHPLLCHPSSTVCESLLWPRQCEFDECSTSALLNHWDSVWEAPLPASNGHCSTPLTHNHTYTQTHRALQWRHLLDFVLFIHVYSTAVWRQHMVIHAQHKYVSVDWRLLLPSANTVLKWHPPPSSHVSLCEDVLPNITHEHHLDTSSCTRQHSAACNTPM